MRRRAAGVTVSLEKVMTKPLIMLRVLPPLTPGRPHLPLRSVPYIRHLALHVPLIADPYGLAIVPTQPERANAHDYVPEAIGMGMILLTYSYMFQGMPRGSARELGISKLPQLLKKVKLRSFWH